MNYRNWAVLEAVENVLAAHPGATHSQVALAWLLTRSMVASVVLGARTLVQLEDNLLAAELLLPPEEINRLDQTSRIEEG